MCVRVIDFLTSPSCTMTTTKSVQVEFSGGLELLFSNKKSQKVEIPTTANGKPTDVNYLIHWLKDNLLKERGELFVDNDTVCVLHKILSSFMYIERGLTHTPGDRVSSSLSTTQIGSWKEKANTSCRTMTKSSSYPPYMEDNPKVGSSDLRAMKPSPLHVVTYGHPVIHCVCRRGATAANAPGVHSWLQPKLC